MSNITTNLKQLVINEAVKLRENATSEELGRLDFGDLDPNNIYDCIYGQLTGNCESERAHDLFRLCSKPYSGVAYKYKRPTKKNLVGRGRSPIEFYILRESAKNATLIQFLRGERDTLTIEDL